jgi:hypothetical protein
MPAIADQVTGLEHNYVAALGQIDSLLSTNTALNALIASLNADKAGLEAQLADLNKHVDDVKAMVENVATGALTMLKTVRAKAETTAKAVVTEGAKVTAEVEKTVSNGIGAALGLVPEAAAPPIAPVVAEPVAGDSGDEQPVKAAVMPANTLVPAQAPTLVQKVESAVDRMLHHSSGSPAHIMRPVDMTMHVEHDDGLPIFLRRGTVFQRGNQATL